MIAKEQALLFEEELSQILDDYESSYAQRTLNAYDIFKRTVNVAVSDEKTYFSGLYAKLLFLYNKHNLNQDLIAKINNYRKYIRKLNLNPSLYCSAEDMSSSVRTALTLLSIVAGAVTDQSLAKFLAEEPIVSYPDEKTEEAEETFKLVVTQRSKEGQPHRIIFGKNEENENVAIYLGKNWSSLWDYVLPYSNISVVSAEKHHERKGYKVYYCKANTFLIYESDFLVDVTEVSNCFQNSGASEYFALLNWLVGSHPSTAMMIGNIVNNLFDALLSNEQVNIFEFTHKELAKSPLQYFYLKKNDEEELAMIHISVEQIFELLEKNVSYVPGGHTFIEPSFIAPEYGLQGRLDALVVDYEDANKKEVIELKSGSYPPKSVLIRNANGVEYSLITWRNHYIQASCYNLILKSVYEARYGNSYIFYAKDNSRPLRNAPILEGNFQEIVALRNNIVGLYFALANGRFDVLAKLYEEVAPLSKGYIGKSLREFDQTIESATPFALEYVTTMLAFTLRELISNKVGKYAENPENAFSSIWQNGNKTNSRKAIANMRLNVEESDFESYYLLFDRTDSVEVNFRDGDQVVLYPTDANGASLLLKEQLLKGVIKSVSNREVTVSLRNKLLGTQFLEQYGYWTLESDFLEHSYKRLPAVLFNFLKDKNFDVKVGRLEQKISTMDFECGYLNEKQTEIVKAAIEADNYYLIQGPPGTGKTSFVLRSIVEHYYRQYRKPLLVKCNILLAAYTNRAVDQICTVLKGKTNIKFIRLGSKESSEHSDVLLSEISADYGLDELDAKFNQTRVVVATVASLLSHSELFDLKYFDLAIVDEAAQILEPYVVNVINKCGKCIMIGDEKQLPAIVSQSRSNYMIENETLSSIEMNDLSASYFQRMLKNAKKNGWTHSYGMLTDQGRMGESIMQLSNELFYQNKLLRLTNMEGPLNEKLSFYGVEAEEKPYLNYAEANYVVRKIAELKGNSETKDMEIGVISPFRTQCSLIKNLLPEELKNEIAIDTVEKFQGSERDVIFISFAVNKAHHLFNISSIVNLEGYDIDRKLNVAITRARQQLYVTGCKPVLEQSPIYKKFIGLLPIEN